jgi:hypothetical protein
MEEDSVRQALEYGYVRYWAHENYSIRDGRLWPQGAQARWYTPMMHPELPHEIAKLRPGDTKAVLRFARWFGLLGYWHLTGQDEGEPLPWIWLHTRTINTCFELTHLLHQDDEAALTAYLATLTEPLAMGIRQWPGQRKFEDVRQYAPHPGLSPTANAKQLRRDIVNGNTGPITRFLLETNDHVERLYFRLDGVLRMAYWHLGTFCLAGARPLVRCEDPKCQAWFAQKEPRQRFCPPLGGARESRCSARLRMRTRRVVQRG